MKDDQLFKKKWLDIVAEFESKPKSIEISAVIMIARIIESDVINVAGIVFVKS